MRQHGEAIRIRTPGRGFEDITETVQAVVRRSEVSQGMCNVFVHHTSAGIILCENADPAVRRDLEAFMQRAVPDGDRIFEHTAEGPDDMPAHVRSVLTGASLTIPVRDGRADLGTWQGIYLWEHRHAAHQRKVTVSVWGRGAP